MVAPSQDRALALWLRGDAKEAYNFGRERIDPEIAAFDRPRIFSSPVASISKLSGNAVIGSLSCAVIIGQAC